MTTLISRLSVIANLDDTEANNVAAYSVLSDYLCDISDNRTINALNAATGLNLSAGDLATLGAAIKAAFDDAFTAAFTGAIHTGSLVTKVTAQLWGGEVQSRGLFWEFLQGPVDPLQFISVVMDYQVRQSQP
jgi:hypothetical protein